MVTRFRCRENGADRVVSRYAVLYQIRILGQESAGKRLLLLAILHTAQAAAQRIDHRLLRQVGLLLQLNDNVMNAPVCLVQTDNLCEVLEREKTVNLINWIQIHGDSR